MNSHFSLKFFYMESEHIKQSTVDIMKETNSWNNQGLYYFVKIFNSVCFYDQTYNFSLPKKS